LKSSGVTTMPPRAVRGPAPAPSSASTGISPKPFTGPTATASWISTSMPSRLSWKSMPSEAGSKLSWSSTGPNASSSIVWVGGTRPPWPTTVGAIVPVPVFVKLGKPISVVESPLAAARNSDTRPETSTASSTATPAGAELVKTKMPSEVRSSSSGSGSWIQKPLRATAVTTPGTCETSSSAWGETWLAPWISWMRRSGPGVLKRELKSRAGWSGGSTSSWSDTPAAATRTVQVVLSSRSWAGSSVKVVGPPETVTGTDVPSQVRLKALGAASTGSLKVTVTSVSVATSFALLGGSTAVTDGAASAVSPFAFSGVAGRGPWKSTSLRSVSGPVRAQATWVVGLLVGRLRPAPSRQLSTVWLDPTASTTAEPLTSRRPPVSAMPVP
jgi:hypothetical protein